MAADRYVPSSNPQTGLTVADIAMRKAQEKRKREAAKKARAEQEAAKAEAEKKKTEELAKTGTTSGDLAVSTDKSGMTFVSGPDGIEHFIYVSPDGSSVENYNYDNVRNKITADYVKRDGDLEKLRRALYDKNFITKADFESKDNSKFNEGLQNAIRIFGTDQIDAMRLGTQKQYMTFDSYLNSLSRSGVGSKVSTDVSRRITTRADAIQEANERFYTYLGRPATKAEANDYYEKLHAAETKAAVKRTGVSSDGSSSVTETGSLIDDVDKFEIFGSVAAKAVKGTDIEQLLKAGGQTAIQMDTLKQHAADYGYQLSDKDALKMVNDIFTKRGTTIDNLKSRIENTSKSLYQNLNLQPDVKVSDIGNNYARWKEEILELPAGSVSIFDNDVQAALHNDGKPGPRNLEVYKTTLRKDPRWQYTRNAKEEAAKFGTNILTAFGLM